ncbi:NAD(P)-binding protein [Venustampulla echinocandica]|uniref:NAD(P)-binding protein n=1 Tax=Venustampulla echinocandica TaxID=2656787 RepID=A0A370TMX4_9HELO|nr:NAD(P)-binding protein [Venustampulla echinocandica]RDL36858.1 NAD(P)-binding protein [Venustampulla echinocandica]
MSHAAYKKIALAGATGTLGSVILKELHESGLFEVTVLVRESSVQNFPEGVKVAKVNFESLDSLAEALAGQEALVSALATLAISVQKLLIDAAVKAGVKRIIPSEFGVDLINPKARALPVYAGKVEIQNYLGDLAAKTIISYTLIFNGPFLDSGLARGLFFNFKERKAQLFDGGDQPISVSRLATVGKAVRRVLTHPRETADRAVRVKDIDVSQKQLLELAQKLTPGEKWDVQLVDTAELEREALQQIKENNIGPLTMYNLVRRAIFSPEFGNKFENVHNEVLGIREITTQDLEEIVHSAFVSK